MFRSAKPVWLTGLGEEKNVLAAFKLTAGSLAGVQLHVTAASFYRLTINGAFAAFGPARTARGYARVDVLDLDSYDCGTENTLILEVAGYNCLSLSTVCQHPFLQAELRRGDEVIAFTGRDFESFRPACKVQKAERYSSQRHFSEVWDFAAADSVTEENGRHPWEVLDLGLGYLERRALYPHYEDRSLAISCVSGTLTHDPEAPYRLDKFSDPINERWGCFPHEEIPHHPFRWIQQLTQHITDHGLALPLTLHENEYAIFDFSRVEVGFMHLVMEAALPSDVVVAFSEYCPDDTFVYTPMNTQNTLDFLLSSGQKKDILSFEPYTFRFVMVAVRKGEVRLDQFGMKTFERDMAGAPQPRLATEALDKVYRGALRTFSHNAVDLYTDCPSRERAGWLCDSYFTGKTEYALFGETPVEDAFLENFALFKSDERLYPGALPMCYPADMQDNGKFIPQWTMWYILEVEEYINKRGHKDLAERFRASVYRLLDFYREFENEDGLLEHLPSWNFVEWSRANQWTLDVNYPTNFLYAQVLEAIDKLYGDETCARRAVQVRKAAVAQSFNGTCFVDHAVRDESGKLVPAKDISEIGQYYAVLFGGIDIHAPEYAALYRMITTDFVPESGNPRDPEIEVVNAFIGVYLRLETLFTMGEKKLLLQDIENFFGQMEAYTGTLWEYREFKGSYDHGFASYVASLLIETADK